MVAHLAGRTEGKECLRLPALADTESRQGELLKHIGAL